MVIASVLMGGIILLAGETFVRPAVDTVTGAIPIVEPSTATGATTLIGPLTMTGSMPVLDSTTATGQMPLVGPALATGAIPVVHAEGADDAAPSHDGPVPGAAGSGGVSALIAHGEFDPGILEDPVFEDEPVPGHAEPASNDSGEQEDSAATTGDAPPAERD